jgi:Ala-tRNA(Pro) deacylase
MPVKKRKEVLNSHRVQYVSIVVSRAYTAQEIALPPRSEQRAGEGRHFEHPMVKVDGRIAMAVLPVPYQIDFARLRVAMGAGTVELASETEFQDRWNRQGPKR